MQLHAENHTFHQELENEQSITREIAEELYNVKHSTIEMASRLEEITSVQEEITTEVKEQLLKQEKTQQVSYKQTRKPRRADRKIVEADGSSPLGPLRAHPIS